MVWSGDGRQIATTAGDHVVAWAVDTWDNVKSFASGRDASKDFEELYCVAWSPQDLRLAAGNDWGEVLIWDTGGNGKPSKTLWGHLRAAISVSWHPNGKWLASASFDTNEGRTVVWDVDQGRELAVYSGQSPVWSPDGSRLAISDYYEHRPCATRVVDVTTGMIDLIAETPGDAISDPAGAGAIHVGSLLAWSPNGRLLAVQRYGNVGLLRVGDARLRIPTRAIEGVAWRPDAKQWATASNDGVVRLWDVVSRSEVAALKDHAKLVLTVAWSPDGRQIATGGVDGTVRIWHGTTGEPVAELPCPGTEIHTLAWSPDGKRLISAGRSHAATIWNIAERRELSKLPSANEAIYATSWSRGGRYVVTAGGAARGTGDDSRVVVWDSETFAPIHELVGHTKTVLAAGFSPEGEYLATSGEDKTLRIWDTATGRNLHTIRVDSPIHSLAWSPDGGRLALGDRAGCLIIWEPTAGGAILSACGHAGTVTSIAWSPDQRTLLTGSTDTTARIWDTGGPQERVGSAAIR